MAESDKDSGDPSNPEDSEDSKDSYFENHDPELSVSSGHVFTENVDEKDNNVKVFHNLGAGKTFSLHSESISVENEFLNYILTNKYNQARKSYTNGTIVNGVQLPREIKGVGVNPARGSSQWGSGLSIDFIKYIANHYSQMETGTLFCVNNISNKGGGDIKGHSSHENGLDIDISYPSSANQCTSSEKFFIPWKTLSSEDSDFLRRNWEFLKFILVDDEVKNIIAIIFSDKKFMKSLCRWAKNQSGIAQEDIEGVLSKLYHQRNHHHHYHIRMKCTLQNPGCTVQNSYTRSKNKVSAKTCK